MTARLPDPSITLLSSEKLSPSIWTTGSSRTPVDGPTSLTPSIVAPAALTAIWPLMTVSAPRAAVPAMP